MTFEGDAGSDMVPPRRTLLHYHGDEVRVIFVINAILLVVAQSTGAELPFSTSGAVIAAVVLVVIAGITNPIVTWIHWVNALMALIGTLLFGTAAVTQYRAGLSFFDSSFMFSEALTFLSLIALYFTTRTIRGIFQRIHLS